MPGISLGLSRISLLLSALHSPHLATPIIHIAGTNGKGSVSAYLSSILLASSLRVGRFNSPHLVDEWDCLQVGGRTIDENLFEAARKTVLEADHKAGIGATSFELLTATAFEVLSRFTPKLDVAVIEVGMGGETDATNVVPSEKTLLSIITSIELDHQKFLGDTVGDIARVKGGIVKQDVDVVVARQAHREVEQALEGIADEQRSQVWFAGEAAVIYEADSTTTSVQSPLVSLSLSPLRTYPTLPASTSPSSPIELRLPLPGDYQRANSAAAVLAAHVLRISPRVASLAPLISFSITDRSILSGIETTTWPGRLDWLSLSLSSSKPPLCILVDGAHNPSSATHLSTYLSSLPPSLAPTTLILALSFPRQPKSIIDPLLVSPSSIRKIICVPFTEPLSMPWIKPTPTKDLASAAKEAGILNVVELMSVREALDSIEEGERVVAAGSLYLAADIYRLAR